MRQPIGAGPNGTLDRQQTVQTAEAMAAEAMRVLAFAQKADYLFGLYVQSVLEPVADPGLLCDLGIAGLAQPLFGVSPFRTAPFPVEWWGWITLAPVSGFLAIELKKLVRQRLGSLAGASG